MSGGNVYVSGKGRPAVKRVAGAYNLELKTFSFTPGFSLVIESVENQKRLNGFLLAPTRITKLKPGVNEKHMV